MQDENYAPFRFPRSFSPPQMALFSAACRRGKSLSVRRKRAGSEMKDRWRSSVSGTKSPLDRSRAAAVINVQFTYSRIGCYNSSFHYVSGRHCFNLQWVRMSAARDPLYDNDVWYTRSALKFILIAHERPEADRLRTTTSHMTSSELLSRMRSETRRSVNSQHNNVQ